MGKRPAEKGQRVYGLFRWCGLEFLTGISLRFPERPPDVQGPARVSVWREVLACACVVATIFCVPDVACAQSTELDGISSLIGHGNLQQAEHRLQRYLQTHPRSAKANNLLGAVYLRQGHFEQAEAVLQKAAAGAPTFLEPRIKLGDAYLAAGKLDSALAAYQDAGKIAPADARIHLALAKLYLGKGEFAKSIEAAQNIPTEKRTDEILPTLAADYLGLNQPEKAGVEIQAMLEVADRQPDLVPELAEFFVAHRDFKSSQQLLAVARKQPVTDRLQVDLALTQAGLGQLDEAQQTLEGVLEHTPGSVAALVAAGQVASQQLNWTAAEEAFSRAANLAPDRPDILYGLVSAEVYGYQTEGALKNARKLHSLVPDDLRSKYLLALALFGARKGEEAKGYAEQVLAAHPDDREMHLILAHVALNSEHDLPGARKQADICLRQNPNDPGALYYLGMVQKMEGDVNGATQSLSKSVAGNPKNADAQAALGALYLQASDVTGAVRALEQAVLLAPEEAQNHYQLALAYSRSGAPDKARTQLDLYRQIKAKEAKEAGILQGPSSSEVPPVRFASRP
jgi:tetratricopeptide (TPR) repeat protein